MPGSIYISKLGNVIKIDNFSSFEEDNNSPRFSFKETLHMFCFIYVLVLINVSHKIGKKIEKQLQKAHKTLVLKYINKNQSHVRSFVWQNAKIMSISLKLIV